MANQISNYFKGMLWKGQIAAESDVFKIILMDQGFEFNKDTHFDYAAVSSAELPTGNGYTHGGQDLTGNTVTVDIVEDRCEVTFNNAGWTASSGSLATVGAIIYNSSTATPGDDYTNAVVAWIDANGTQIVAEGAALTISQILLTAEDIATS